MGVAITTGARHTAHTISLVIDAVIIGGLCIYVQYKSKDRDPYPYSFWKKYGPTILCWLSFPLIIADPLRHVLNDTEAWESCNRDCHQLWPSHCNWSSNEYKCALKYGELLTPKYGFNNTCTWCNYTYSNITTINGTNYQHEYWKNVSCTDDKYDFAFTCVHDSQETITHLAPMGILFTIFFTYIGFILFLIGNLWNANIIEKCREIRHKYRVLRGKSEDDDY